MHDRRQLWIIGLICALAAALGFHHIGTKTFWFDEGVSAVIARLDWSNFAHILWRREGNMSLYYLLLRGWIYLGRSEAFLRSLSLLFAVATIPAIYALGRRLFSHRAGLIAAALLAVNAYEIHYAQEARSYALMNLLCVLSSLFFLKWIETPSLGNRLGYVGTSALAVYAQFFALLLIVAQWVSLALLEKRSHATRVRRDWLWIALAVTPVLVFIATTGAGPLRWVPRPGMGLLLDFWVHLCGNAGPWLPLLYTAAGLLALAPVITGPRSLRAEYSEWRYRFLGIWLVLPILLTVVASFVRPLFVDRYFIFCLPALLLLAAGGLDRLHSGWLVAGALAAFLALSLRGTLSYYHHDFDRQRDDWRAASRFVLNNSKPGDGALFFVAMGRMPYEYYRSLTTAEGPQLLYPYHGERISYLDFVEKPDFAQIEKALPGVQRVWLVFSYAGSGATLDPTAKTLRDLTARDHPACHRQSFTGIEVLVCGATAAQEYVTVTSTPP